MIVLIIDPAFPLNPVNFVKALKGGLHINVMVEGQRISITNRFEVDQLQVNRFVDQCDILVDQLQFDRLVEKYYILVDQLQFYILVQQYSILVDQPIAI